MIQKKLKLFLLVIALPAVLLSLVSQMNRQDSGHSTCGSVCCVKEKCKTENSCSHCKGCGSCESEKPHRQSQ